MIHGWVVLDKPYGLGSTQAVAAVKRGLREVGIAKPKVGHGGTLDPLATGVLPIALGEATKLAGRMLDATKAYRFTLAFGVETDTLDAEGSMVARNDHRPHQAAVAAVLARFTGPITQVPPAYSALKIDGKRAHERARAGEVVEPEPRAVTIHTLTLEDCGADSATFAATVSKGTYIRSLARDIARALGTVGHVTMLRRTKAGPFGLAQAISLDKWTDAAKARDLEHFILPFEAGLDDIPALSLDPGPAEAIRQGRVLTGVQAGDGLYLARAGNVPIALVTVAGGDVRVLRGLNLM